MESAHTAVLVGLGQTVHRIHLERGGLLNIVHSPDAQTALREIESHSPHLVIVDATLDSTASGDFLGMIVERFPDFHSPVIVVNLKSSNPDLSIHEWDVENERFGTRTAPPGRLRPEIERLCGRSAPEMDGPAHEDVRRIGYNDSIERGDRSFHVQTEVMGKDEMTIRTTIIERGAIVDTIVQSCRGQKYDVVQSTKVTESQHNAAIAEVERGRYG